MAFQVDCLKPAHERWVAANARCNAKMQREREEKERAEEIIDVEDADVEDIDKLYAEKGTGPHMFELEFEPVVTEPVEKESSRGGHTIRIWPWRHKLTKKEVNWYASVSGLTWDTGKLSKYLSSLTEKQHPIAYQRARRIFSFYQTKQLQKRVRLAPLTALD